MSGCNWPEIAPLTVSCDDTYLFYHPVALAEARRYRALNLLVNNEQCLAPDWKDDVVAIETYLRDGVLPEKKSKLKSV